MNTKQKIPILIIENNAQDVQSISAHLEEAGIKYDLTIKDSLHEGIAYLNSHPVRLTLMEINLPDSSGFKTITTFIERAPDASFMVITNSNNEIIGNQAIKAGAEDFLVKGQFKSNQFGRSVRYALYRSKSTQQLKEKAKELESNKKRYLEAQEMARFGTWEMEIVSNEMFWSDEVYRILSLHPGSTEPSLSNFLSFVHIDDKDKVEDFFDTLISGGELLQLEHRVVLDGTHIVYLNLQGKIQIDESGKILLVGSLQDITERKLSEKLIIEKNISSKTAKVQEEVLSDLSFQIRTPLSSIVNLLFLLEGTKKSPKQGDYLNDLKTSVDDLALSVNNLLNFSVMVSDDVKIDEELFNIREFLQGTKNVITIKAANASINIALNLSDNLPEKIISDQKKLTQILYNLVDNAIKYGNENGHVIVSAGFEEPEDGKANLMLTVEDNGIGMNQEQVEQLLEADKLLLEAATDTGSDKKKQLGVAIVTKLTKNLNGSMEIQSKPGKGSVFSISIPIKVPIQAKHISGGKPLAPLKILLVEDHKMNQLITKNILINWSEFVSVDIAENGLVGYEKFKEYGYDIVLMDLFMPVMNGMDSARKIRELSQVPIIALTANSSKEEQDNCFKVGMNDYLSKPFNPQELLDRIMATLVNVFNSPN